MLKFIIIIYLPLTSLAKEVNYDDLKCKINWPCNIHWFMSDIPPTDPRWKTKNEFELYEPFIAEYRQSVYNDSTDPIFPDDESFPERDGPKKYIHQLCYGCKEVSPIHKGYENAPFKTTQECEAACQCGPHFGCETDFLLTQEYYKKKGGTGKRVIQGQHVPHYDRLDYENLRLTHGLPQWFENGTTIPSKTHIGFGPNGKPQYSYWANSTLIYEL